MSTHKLLDQVLASRCESKLSTDSLNLVSNLITDEPSEAWVATQITKLISSSSSKLEGLDLLNVCLLNFSPQIIAEHGPGWIRCCLNHHETGQGRELYLKTLANIIKNSQNHPEFSKKFVSDFLTSTLDTSLKPSAHFNVQEASLSCLVSCLSFYGGSCNIYRKKIEDSILNYLSTSSAKLVSVSGLAFFYSQKIGSAGNEGCSHVNNITVSIRRLCVTCHKLLDSIFEHQVEFERYESNEIEPFNVNAPPLHYNTLLKLQYRVQVLKNCLHWIMILLGKMATKVLHPQELLSVIQRAIFLHVCQEQNNLSVELAHFSSHLKRIHVEILKVLEILIHQMGYLLVPFYHTITKIIMDTITRSQSCNCYLESNLLQEYAYNVLSVWLKVGGNGFDQSIQDKLVSCVIRDAFPVTNAIGLKMDSNLVGKPSKIKCKSFQNKILGTTNLEIQTSLCSKIYKLNICFNALNMLYIFLTHTYLSLSESVINKLYTSLIKALLSLQNGKATFPFTDQRCELLLYEITSSLFEQDTIKILPPIQIILNVLQMGCKHENQRIAASCFRGLNNLEKICQPVCSSLYTNNNEIIKNGTACLQLSEIKQPDPIEHIENSSGCLDSGDTENSVKMKEKKLDLTILYDNIVVPSKSVVSTCVNEVIEIEDDVDETFTESVMVDVEQDTHLLDSSFVLPDKPSKVDISEDTKEPFGEPTAKKMKTMDDDMNHMFHSLVDIVNDEYQ